MKFVPHAYQRKAIEFGVSRACAGLLLDPGLGKTSIMYAVFSILKARGIVDTMLVIAPLRPAYSVWPAEARKWDDFAHLKVAVLHGPGKEDALRSKADVFVINPEGLPWLFAHKGVRFDVLTVDESTKFKHTNTERFKTLRPHLPNFARRYILTGSPAPNGLLDLFGQAFILDLGNALGPYITHYRQAFFAAKGYGGFTYTPRPGAEQEIYHRLAPLAMRMAARDYLDLPDLIGAASGPAPLLTEVTLPAAARRAYDRMENLLIAELEKEVVVAPNAAAAYGKCRQIANGGLYGAAGEDGTLNRNTVHSEKLDAVEEIVDGLSGVPALVAYEYDHERERLQERFKDAPYIGGGVTPKRFKEIEREWNAGNIPILLAQPQSVAHGLNLQGTRGAIIWHSPTPNLEHYEQLIARVWRQGQKERVFVHHVVAKNTIDQKLLSMLQRKDGVQKALFAGLKALYKPRRKEVA